MNLGSSQEYYQFGMGSYVPTTQALGMQMNEAWHTAYGVIPNRLVVFITDDRESMLRLLDDETWLKLNEQLEPYVSEFNYKVIPYRGGFQI